MKTIEAIKKPDFYPLEKKKKKKNRNRLTLFSKHSQTISLQNFKTNGPLLILLKKIYVI